MGVSKDVIIAEREILKDYAAQVTNDFWKYLESKSINIAEEKHPLVVLYREVVALKNTLNNQKYDHYRNVIETSGKFNLIDSFLKAL